MQDSIHLLSGLLAHIAVLHLVYNLSLQYKEYLQVQFKKQCCFNISINLDYCKIPTYWEKNSADPDQTQQNAASDQGLHCSPLSQTFFFHRSTSRKMDVQILRQVW